MGFGMAYATYLSNKGYLNKPGLAVLDIGSQCLLAATQEAINEFLKKHAHPQDPQKLAAEAERIAYFSTPRPGERTAYLSELLDLTDIRYTSYDVCPALKTEIFDLNRETVPSHYREHFDVVLNFGTTEHIINQFNCFRVVHDALAVGGIAMHQLPSTGYVNHGYFCYHLTLFNDLAQSNDYEIVDRWYTPSGTSNLAESGIDVRNAETPAQTSNKSSDNKFEQIPSFLINVVMRKRSSRPFSLPLELATAHAAISGQVAQAIENVSVEASGAIDNTGQTVAPGKSIPSGGLAGISGRQLAHELSRRVIRRVFPNQVPRLAPESQLLQPLEQNASPVETPAPAKQPSDNKFRLFGDAQVVNDGSLNAEHHYLLGKSAQDSGNFDQAFGRYRKALALIHQYGPAKNQMQVMSSVYLTEAGKTLELGDTAQGKRLLVRALELDPGNRNALSHLEQVIATEKKRDLTKHCYIFHDPQRAETIHREAVRRCLEYVSIAGVVGDVLEFGVLAGWSARIFCETMRDLMNPGDLHLFDSFDGLPEYTSEVDVNSYEIGGRDIWSNKMRFTDEFVTELGSSIDSHVRDRLSGVISAERIRTYRGFYSETLKKPLNIKAAIVHIDCDLYKSTVEVLWALYNNNVFQDGCVLMFDDWNCNKASPNYGERKAFQEFLEKQGKYTSSLFFTYGFNGASFFLHDRTA